MHHWLRALFWSFHVRMVVGRILIVVEKVYSEVLFVSACVCVIVCIYGERGISMWVRAFTPWPQTGVLKPLWQCVQTAFSLLLPPSIALCHSLHPRGHVLRHLHPGSVRVIPPPHTLPPLKPVFSTHSSVLPSPNMLLDTPHTPPPLAVPLLPPPLLSIPPSLLGSGVSNQCLSCLIPSRCFAAVCVCVCKHLSMRVCLIVVSLYLIHAQNENQGKSR